MRTTCSSGPATQQRFSHHFAIFADDVIQYAQNLEEKLSHIIRDVILCGEHSGLRINGVKSKILPLYDCSEKSLLNTYYSGARTGSNLWDLCYAQSHRADLSKLWGGI
ncbi:hypothetical protein NDU88_004502 [Pleurodeles waltl]|uniref:Reverse transcriptase domain-containing protein n=1 Tax=Pleurodeles waltl TaxID=8319 RepID=A0AAV7NJV3_PLEWA|nr:hypothetical protein NDU88_004502 [Pleurodeles waltl]